MRIILNDEIEGKLHYLLIEMNNDVELGDIPIGIIKAKYGKNCFEKIVNCINLRNHPLEIIKIEVIDGDGLNFYVLDVTFFDMQEKEEGIKTYALNILPIF